MVASSVGSSHTGHGLVDVVETIKSTHLLDFSAISIPFSTADFNITLRDCMYYQRAFMTVRSCRSVICRPRTPSQHVPGQCTSPRARPGTATTTTATARGLDKQTPNGSLSTLFLRSAFTHSRRIATRASSVSLWTGMRYLSRAYAAPSVEVSSDIKQRLIPSTIRHLHGPDRVGRLYRSPTGSNFHI